MLLKTRRLRAAHSAQTLDLRLPALTGVEIGGGRAALRRIGSRERWRGEPIKPACTARSTAAKAAGAQARTGNDGASGTPETGEEAHNRRRAEEQCTAQGGGSPKAETQDRKHAPSFKGGARSDGDHIGQSQNIGSRTFRYRRLLPSERPCYYLI